MPVSIDRIIRSKRRTVALIVEYDGSVTVRAPMRLSESAIREFAEKHIDWVVKKKAEMRAVIPPQQKQYHPGETFLYLGKEYALEVAAGQHKRLILDDHFKIAESALGNAELVFQKWYRQQATHYIPERVKFFAELKSTSLREDQDHICPHALGLMQSKEHTQLLMASYADTARSDRLCDHSRTGAHRPSQSLETLLESGCEIDARLQDTSQTATPVWSRCIVVNFVNIIAAGKQSTRYYSQIRL